MGRLLQRSQSLGSLLLIVPALILLVGFLLLPVLLIGLYSVYSTDPVTGLMRADFTTANYVRLITSPVYRRVLI